MRLPIRAEASGAKQRTQKSIIFDSEDHLIAQCFFEEDSSCGIYGPMAMISGRTSANNNADRIVKSVNAIPYVKDYLAQRIHWLDCQIQSNLNRNVIDGYIHERKRITELLEMLP